jgi:putative ABC transport system ATP-binding protein
VSALELLEIVKHYTTGGESVRAVDGVSLTVQPGELVALFGPSGSGKTTLLMIAAGLLTPDSGSALFNGRDVTRFSDGESAEYRLHDVGLVIQSFHLMAGADALTNAAIKLLADGMSLKDAKEVARPWLELVGLGDRAEHRPAALSMGERQRVAIARALVNDPKLLLTDEPTGNLDTKRSREILTLLRDICAERCIPGLLVTHDLQAAVLAHRVFTLQDGCLREGGPIEPVLQ